MDKGDETYRGYRITYNPKPIPDFRYDWDYTHEDYDLDDCRYGSAASIEECKAEIDDLEDDWLPHLAAQQKEQTL